MPKRRLAPWQFRALYSPYEHYALLGGVGSGKSYTGAQFVIDRLMERPDLRGFIGANTHDQLSQVALRELFHWFAIYGFEYMVDTMPPLSWQKRLFKSYKNIITVKTPAGHVTNIFTRVLSKGDNLRGLEFAWYWIDETRDTPNYTHDVILARMRQDKEYRRGLVTSTTNGHDWVYQRFVKGMKPGKKQFGSAHVTTQDSVNAGIVSQAYMDTMLESLSPLMADQELFAKHVNVAGGRAYYAFNEANEARVSPWGDRYPNPERSLIVGCDFNWSPAPCVWTFGQIGPENWDRHIHWFGEIAEVEASTETMTGLLLMRVPGFYYRIFGDASGNRGTTSNAGETDYFKIAGELDDAGVFYAIDSDQANPFVRDRVEAMNAMGCNGLGNRKMTYNPDTMPLLHGDLSQVGYSKSGKLQGPDHLYTHASDGAGYAVYKLFGPHSVGVLDANVPSPNHE